MDDTIIISGILFCAAAFLIVVLAFWLALFKLLFRQEDYMSMRRAADRRTVCEVLREINDLHQGKEEHDTLVRYKLFECERMAKSMTRKLYENNKQWDAKFWADNPDYEKDLLKRLGTSYLTGQPIPSIKSVEQELPIPKKEEDNGNHT